MNFELNLVQYGTMYSARQPHRVTRRILTTDFSITISLWVSDGRPRQETLRENNLQSGVSSTSTVNIKVRANVEISWVYGTMKTGDLPDPGVGLLILSISVGWGKEGDAW